MRKNSFKNFRLASLSFSLYTKICLGLSPYIKNRTYLGNFSSSVQHIPHNSFPYQKSWWKVQVNVVTPQELGVYGESNEINREKNCFVFIRSEKKLFAFDKVCKKSTFKLAIERKSLIPKKNHSPPPTYQMVRP